MTIDDEADLPHGMDTTLRFRRSLARRLAEALGISLAALPAAHAVGCGGKVVVDDVGALSGGAGGSGGGGASTGGPTGANATTGVSTATGSSTGGCTETTTGTNGGGIYQTTFCLGGPPDQCPQGGEAIAAIDAQLAQSGCDTVISLDCGAFTGSDQTCCYTATVGQCDVGRPFLVDERLVIAPAGAATGWRAEHLAPEVQQLPAAVRHVLGDRWTATALLEHASIASFARFALDLLAVGAPADLVRLAHAAALDEVEHARMSFAIATAFAAAPVAPGPFPFGGSASVAGDLVALATAAAAEGCIGETVSAVLAAEQLARATDPSVRRALAGIAEDEARHAELAWRTVAWALDAGGAEVAVAVRAVFAEAARRVPHPPAEPNVDGALLAAYGVLDAATFRAAVARAVDEIVLPCARGLLEPRGGPRRAQASAVVGHR